MKSKRIYYGLIATAVASSLIIGCQEEARPRADSPTYITVEGADLGKDDSIAPARSPRPGNPDDGDTAGKGNGSGNGNGGVVDDPDNTGPSAPSNPGLPFDLPNVPNSQQIGGNFIPFSQEAILIQSDLATIRNTRPSAIPFIRYITLSHLDYLEFKNDQAFVEFKTDLINSVSVLINHLSTEFVIAKPEPLESSMSTFRIDIRDYGWDRNEWERLVSDNRNDRNKEAYPYANNFDITVRQIAQEIRTRVPIVRGDWLLTEATKPNSYHDLLDIPQNLQTLERNLGLNRNDNIVRTIEDAVKPKSIRAAIPALRSGVSVQNRVIDRHDSLQGYYWISYDFAEANGDPAKNVFGAPIGPGNRILNDLADNDFFDQTAFQPDGGEVIFELPNGLQAYMLVDGFGRRLNRAPINIVFDPNARIDGGEIVNGSSCLGCHGAGIIEVDDSMRKFVEKADRSLIPQVVVDAVQRLHPPQAELDAVFSKDNVNYRTIAGTAFQIGKRKDRIDQVLDYYEAPMSYDMLASELNITVDQLENAEDLLRDSLVILVEASKASNLDRNDFERAFNTFIDDIFGL